MGPRFRGDDDRVLKCTRQFIAAVQRRFISTRSNSLRITRQIRRGRCHGTPPLSETRLWICRRRRSAGRQRPCRTACAASACSRRTVAALGRRRASRCYQRRRGGSSQARRSALGPRARASSRLASWPPLGLAPPSLGLAPAPLGLAPPPPLAPAALASPLLAPPLLVSQPGVTSLEPGTALADPGLTSNAIILTGRRASAR
jgi:hypothetical protein